MFDVVIIGAGCAGMTAAVYALRAGCSVKLLECESIGGQISFSPRVENFPSVKQISGTEFSDNLFTQATDLGAAFGFEKVTEIKDGKIKTVVTTDGEYQCYAVIVAVGMKHRKLPIENFEDYVGKGVSYCAVCDGIFFKGKDVAVVGGGNTALQDALYLSEYCSKVTLIHRRNEFRGDFALVEKLKSVQNVEFIMNSNVTAVGGEENLDEITITDNDGKSKKLKVDGLFCAVGQLPQNTPFESLIKLDDGGFVDSDENCKTTANGIFVAGDCRKKEVRQLTTAASDGAVAALAAADYVKNIK